MGWDRVIQDSDEDEPLGDYAPDGPVSTEPFQCYESPNLETAVHQTVEQHADQQNKQPEAEGMDAVSDLAVNFDQFLQSQNMSQAEVTLSQQRREERWIPSTADGGGGSIGAMLTEIGHAQRRLLDDDACSAGQLLSCKASAYPSEFTESGSNPSIPTYTYSEANDVSNDNYMDTGPVVTDPCEGTHLVPPTHINGYDYSTPATSNNVGSPSCDFHDNAATFSASTPLNDGVYANPQSRSAQRSRSMQSHLWSPHDTEPLSSIVSPGLSRSKSDNVRSGLMSPQHSEGSTHDELALPLVPSTTAVDTSTVRKKRGRLQKQSLPDDDEEEDELAAPRNYFTRKPSWAAEVGRSESSSGNPEVAKPNAIDVDDDDDDDELCTEKTKSANTAPTLMVVLPLAYDDGQAKNNVASEPIEPEVANTKPPKKKKVKRCKTASAVLDKATEVTVDDDVIWLDSNPVQVDENAITEPTNHRKVAQNPPLEGTTDTSPADEVHGPKKRGRKRKNPPEQQPQGPSRAPTPPIPTAKAKETKTESLQRTSTPITHTKETTPALQQDSECKPLNDLAPQTPHRPEGKENEPATVKGSHTGPSKHSPILSTTKVPYRVGLSRRARIAPLLKVVRK